MGDEDYATASYEDAPTSYPGDTDPPAPHTHPETGWSSLSSPATSLAWDAVGAIPGVGNVVSGIGAVVDLAEAAIDTDHASDHLKDAALDGFGAIPIAGNIGHVVHGAVDLYQIGSDVSDGATQGWTPEVTYDVPDEPDASVPDQADGGTE